MAEKHLSLRRHLQKKVGAAEIDHVAASAVAHLAAVVQVQAANAREASLADKADLVMGKVTTVLAVKREATAMVVVIVDPAVAADHARTVNPVARRSLR